MTLVPADGAAWSAPTPHLLPEAGVTAELRFALGGSWLLMSPLSRTGCHSTSPYTRLELPLFFVHSSPRLGLCPIITEATSPHLSPALRVPSYSLAVIFGTGLLLSWPLLWQLFQVKTLNYNCWDSLLLSWVLPLHSRYWLILIIARGIATTPSVTHFLCPESHFGYYYRSCAATALRTPIPGQDSELSLLRWAPDPCPVSSRSQF